MKNISLFALIAVLGLVLFNCGDKPKEESNPVTVAPTLTPEQEKGEELFAANCVACHGEKGLGDGPAAAAMNPKPRSFKSPVSEWKNGPTEAGITTTLNKGIPGGAMVAYSSLGPDALKALTAYVLYLHEN